MYNTNDDILINYRSGRLSKSEYKVDLESVIANGAYHSDEVSETDDEKSRRKLMIIFVLKIKRKRIIT